MLAILLAVAAMSVYQGFVLVGGQPNDRAVAIGFFSSGALTLLALSLRNRLAEMNLLSRFRPRWSFVLVGGVCAALVETFFWAAEKATGATGVAASPDLAVDLLVTMPWYLLMLAVLWKVLTRYRYTFWQLLLMGGVYELGADGIVGSLLGGRLEPVLLIFLPIFFPVFIVVYSAMIVPAAIALRDELESWPRADEPEGRWRKASYALLPLLGLLPYLIIFVPFLLLAS